MTSIEEQAEQLRKAYENDILDETTYKAALEGIGIDISDSNIGIVGDHATVQGDIQHGDRIGVDSGGDVSFAKDHGISLILKHLNLTIQAVADIKKTLHRYLTDLAAETDRLPWGRLSPEQAGPDQGESLRLSDVYTALDTTEPERMDCEDDVRQCLARQARMERISAQRMINDHDRLVLLGDPGSGKTTLVNFLTHVMACAGTEKEPDACVECLKKAGKWELGSLFPLRIILREFAAWVEKDKDRKSDIGAFLRSILNEDGYSDELWEFIHEGLQNTEVPFLVFFDGLDEVPATIRQQVVKTINAFAETYQHNRYVVTCRIYAYTDQAFRLRGFRQTVLAPFSEEQISHFIDAWYGELAAQKRMKRADAERLAEGLKSAISDSDLLALAERPLIMTVMALLHTSYGQLPEDRVELYRWAVELLFRRWKGQVKGEKSLMAALDMPQLRMSDLEAGLYHVAFYAHSGHSHSKGTADIPEEVLLKQLKPYIGSWDKAEIFVRYIRERAGLLIRHKTDAYTFPHRTFQEFMAACHITGLKEYPSEAAKLIREDPDRWRIVFVLAAGHAARTHQLGNAIAAVTKLCPVSIGEAETPDKAAFVRAVISGEALLEIGLVGVNREEDGKIILDRVKGWLLAGMQADDVLQPRERVEAGNILSQLGDPRFNPDMWYLPNDENLGFVTVPAGPFLMGSDKEKDSGTEYDEMPRHMVELSEYAITRYPVTVAQFGVFVEDSGFELEVEDSGFELEDEYCLRGANNHPVVWVSWDEADAYCRWLTKKLKDRGTVRLPTEAQWEKAARGTDGRIYPCGDNLVSGKTNYGFDIGSTSPVGAFPEDVSPYGCMDMTGNVSEWCFDGMRNYTEHAVTDPIGPVEKSPDRVFRSGSWDDPAQFCRAANRYENFPNNRNDYIGFRLVLLPS
ncbi:hypothetical protein DENIS_2016 [Desulfonema ishimotonii]|uniref:Uncharacterized protein n=1 Tax=Desulfonema ishimotonii TaxID=45657 RepID=A0A401FVQ5_9BACT|nr:SUMF1/EgtB/PvdO family nonheme iron enzyme [Desulfonema ishimotonii]GBC61056.1 hypothetical protein DENIS_2016 [Desulfonema ishimotonii]